MAITKTVTTPHGFEAADAYHRAECPQFGLDKVSVSVMLRSYRTGVSGEPFFAERSVNFIYDSNGGTVYSQAYSAIKQLDEFSDAGDC